MMRELQDLGHTVIFLIGGMTTRIGDPTGKSETRKIISTKDIQKNTKEFIKQVSKILRTDKSVFEIRNNYDWFGKMKAEEFLSLLSQVTHAQLIERDMFQKRIKEGKEIRMHEMLYPILQGYDSVVLKSDLTIVGNDQLFNEKMGRFFQEKFGQPPQAIITTKITPGLDGVQKQSKSLGNYIAITDIAKDMFGKLMSLPDSLVKSYFYVYTSIPDSDIKKMFRTLHPRDFKMRLAHTIVSMYHGVKAADRAQSDFVSVFQKHDLPKDLPSATLSKPMPIMELLAKHKLASSNSDARRLIQQGGVKLDDQTITDINFSVMPPKRVGKTSLVLQVGKRRFLKLK
jgi:tyrosyl-tRNA synthetase